ncbi:hypothetical protein HRR77_007204 [Exophiala dermatitidis]|nr:hypothetical protein HRR77_007204 [Exophiala dermatitidis]KAJ4609313.1 hypothetical protein HRR85_006901 [Exophiala dermatitidis]KAJ4692105.1 hypothetical protein HRR87_007052 [Exophiala dermatitidis]
MCKHILNAQVSIRSPCCKFIRRQTRNSHGEDEDGGLIPRKGRKWFDCAECHAESEDHPLLQSFDMTFICKKCKKAFRKNTKDWDESDEYCPNCDNHFVIDAVTPKAALKVESDDTRMDARMLKDERVKQAEKSIFDIHDWTGRLG